MIRNSFGTELEVVSSGTAPLTPSVRSFMRQTFGEKFIGEGYDVPLCGVDHCCPRYGTQESGLITLERVIQPNVEAGIVSEGNLLFQLFFQVKLVSVDGYSVTDRPNPRGHILVKTQSLISHYLRPGESPVEVLLCECSRSPTVLNTGS